MTNHDRTLDCPDLSRFVNVDLENQMKRIRPYEKRCGAPLKARNECGVSDKEMSAALDRAIKRLCPDQPRREFNFRRRQ